MEERVRLACGYDLPGLLCILRRTINTTVQLGWVLPEESISVLAPYLLERVRLRDQI